jgi:voltage-gated potassium channel
MIIAATVVVTVLGAVLMRVVDPTDFPTFGDSAWWALQTVTTVGYGDVTPVQPMGRIVGGVVLLYSVALMSILTAAVTTSFIERARNPARPEQPDLDALLSRLEAVLDRLDQPDDRPEGAEPTDQP